MNHWCQDWANERFQIYTIPGHFNFYNDFHSRNGAPDSNEFYTLAEHAAKLDEKLMGLTLASNCAKRSPSPKSPPKAVARTVKNPGTKTKRKKAAGEMDKSAPGHMLTRHASSTAPPIMTSVAATAATTTANTHSDNVAVGNNTTERE